MIKWGVNPSLPIYLFICAVVIMTLRWQRAGKLLSSSWSIFLFSSRGVHSSHSTPGICSSRSSCSPLRCRGSPLPCRSASDSSLFPLGCRLPVHAPTGSAFEGTPQLFWWFSLDNTANQASRKHQLARVYPSPGLQCSGASPNAKWLPAHFHSLSESQQVVCGPRPASKPCRSPLRCSGTFWDTQWIAPGRPIAHKYDQFSDNTQPLVVYRRLSMRPRDTSGRTQGPSRNRSIPASRERLFGRRAPVPCWSLSQVCSDCRPPPFRGPLPNWTSRGICSWPSPRRYRDPCRPWPRPWRSCSLRWCPGTSCRNTKPSHNR